MALIICDECGKEFSSKAHACPNCGCPRDPASLRSHEVASKTLAPQPSVEKDPYPREKVIQHLSYAAALEKSIFTYKKMYECLESRIGRLGYSRKIPEPPPLREYRVFSPMWAFFPVFLIALVILSANSGDFLSDVISVISVIFIFFNTELLERAAISAMIGLGAALLFVVIKALIVSSKRKKLDLIFREALAKDRERVAAEHKLIVHLRQQQTDIQFHLKANGILLKNLYALDIISPEYRHMTAVLTMLGYLQSRRCTQLIGHGGAYDTFAFEALHKKIIEKLDVAIGMLDQIRQSQFLLYEAICDANNTLQRIQSQSERIISGTDRIEKNTALTAYNTSVIRQNTEISAYVDAFHRT